MNFASFPVAQIRKLEAAEIGAVFDADVNASGSANLYRLNIPGSRRFLRHNTLCGTEDVQWMITYVLNKDLRVAFFSGSSEPVLQFDSLRNSTSLCGTFSYAR
jgi:hypothetical protein